MEIANRLLSEEEKILWLQSTVAFRAFGPNGQRAIHTGRACTLK